MVVVMKNVVMDTEKLMRGKSGREGNMKGTKTEIGIGREEGGLKGKTDQKNITELKKELGKTDQKNITELKK